MAITRVQFASDHGGPDKNPHQGWGDPVAAGNLTIAIVAWSESAGDATCTMAGWTLLKDVNLPGKVRQATFMKIATGTDPNRVDAKLSASRRWNIMLVEVNTDTAAGWQVDVPATASGTSTAPVSGTTLVTATATEYWVAGISCQNKDSLSSPSNGFAKIIDEVAGSTGADKVSSVLLDQIASSAIPASTGGTYSASRPYVGTVVTFRAVAVTQTGAAALSGSGLLAASTHYDAPTLIVQAAFGSGPGDENPVFTDITPYVQTQGGALACQWQYGRENELNQTQAGRATIALLDEDSHFDPNNSPSPSYPATEFAATVLAKSPRIWLRVDEALGSFTDSSGLGHTGTAVGGVTYAVPGAITGHTAITLDGTTGYVTVAHHSDLNLADVYTLALWVMRTGSGTDDYLISKGTGAYGLFITAGSGVVQLVKTNTRPLRNSSINILPDGIWHRVIGVKDGSRRRDVYIDGVLRNGTDFGDATCVDTSAALNIGREVSTNTSFATCSIDEPALFASAFTDADVAADYQAARGGSPFYPHVKPGLPVRATIYFGSDVYPLFCGYVERIPRTIRAASAYTERQLDLVDGFALLANAGLSGHAYPEQYSHERVTAVLNDIGWPQAARRIGTGVSVLQEVAFAEDDDTRAQAHLQEVGESENGLLFVDGAGRVVFVGRHELFGDTAYTVPKAIFGDNEVGSALAGWGAGGWGAGPWGGGSTPVYAYTDLVPSYDIDNVVNKAVITRTNGSPQTWEDTSSQRDYFLRVKQQGSLVSTDGEALNQAQWKVGLFSRPINRIREMTIEPVVDPADGGYIDAGLAREVGDRITIVETPPGFAAEQRDEYVIQQIRGEIPGGPINGLKLTLGVWPASVAAFWLAGDTEQSLAGVSTRPGY